MDRLQLVDTSQHGRRAELNHLNQPNILKTINYPNTDVSIDLYPNVLGAFSYYHIDVLKDVGLMDENFYNAMEHVDHTYQIIKKGYNPPFRYFVDVNGSEYSSMISKGVNGSSASILCSMNSKRSIFIVTTR